jgi:hypothetical protein
MLGGVGSAELPAELRPLLHRQRQPARRHSGLGASCVTSEPSRQMPWTSVQSIAFYLSGAMVSSHGDTCKGHPQ